MNVFKYYPWRATYYLKKPWKFFEDTWLNIKAAWQRAAKGFADRDTWNLDEYLLELLPNMIDHLRTHTHGYPGYGKFDTPEKWDKFLKEEIIEPLRNASEEQKIQINEYEEELHSYPMNFVKQEDGFTAIEFTEPEELRKKWMNRENEIIDWRNEQLSKALFNLNTYWWHLWD